MNNHFVYKFSFCAGFLLTLSITMPFVLPSIVLAQEGKGEAEAPIKMMELIPPPKPDAPQNAAPEEQKKLLTHGLQRFGRDFYAPARAKIIKMEKDIVSGKVEIPTIAQRDALSGFVGPLEMVTSSVYATIPNRYVLTPGDQMTVSYWGKMLEIKKIPLVVDEKGDVTLQEIGKIVARGMTLDQFQAALKTALKRVTVNDLELIATLDRLQSIQIFVTGETFRPGSYAISAVTTLFNALYASGGPADMGSLRDIRLLRNQKTIRVDFYDYLLRGESHGDIPLQTGDTIFIAPVTQSVSIDGEVLRPAVYELKEQEGLKTLIEMAGGVKATSILQRVLVQTLSPNKEKIVKEQNITQGKAMPEMTLYDGDSVFVFPVMDEIKNSVTLEGRVERPGVYELKDGMRVSSLFSEINQPLGETWMERADIIRMNDDFKTTTLIPVHLGRALDRDPQHNILLASMDRIIIYSKFDVQFYPKRNVTIYGAVQRPASYLRSDGMRLKDLLLVAGGPLPGYHDRIEIARAHSEKEIKLFEINLTHLKEGDETQNILLMDEDVVSVRKKTDFFDIPLYVTIEGEVKYPGTYPLHTRGDRVSDVLKRAGGFTEMAYPKGAVFTRSTEQFPSKEQRHDLAIVNDTINLTNDLEYERQVARNRFLFMREQSTASLLGPSGTISTPIVGGEGNSTGLAAASSTSQAVGQVAAGTFDAMQPLASVVNKPRRMSSKELQPTDRIIIKLDEAILHPGGKDDMVLQSGDILRIDTRPTEVSILGSVIRPTTIIYWDRKKVDYYVTQSGGYAPDANKKNVMVLRIDGSIVPASQIKFVSEGDVLYVPPQVVSMEIVERIDKIIDVVKFALVTLASVKMLIFFIGLV